MSEATKAAKPPPATRGRNASIPTVKEKEDKIAQLEKCYDELADIARKYVEFVEDNEK